MEFPEEDEKFRRVNYRHICNVLTLCVVFFSALMLTFLGVSQVIQNSLAPESHIETEVSERPIIENITYATEQLDVIKQEEKTESSDSPDSEKSSTEKTTTASEPTNVSEPQTPNGNGAAIYLTFDDGPSDKNTSQILDLLKQHNAKASFFVTRLGSDELIKREFDEGHTVALHTWSHNYATVYASVNNYFSDLEQVENRVYKITGQYSKFIRFPGGSSNTVSRKYTPGIMTTLVSEVEKRGYIYFDWSSSSGDGGSERNVDNLFNNVIANISPNGKNVVLMHDTVSQTVEVTARVLDWGTKNGYVFKSISETSPTAHHGVNN